MFEGMDKQEARQAILDSVAAYYQKYEGEQHTFQPGDSIRYAGRVYDEHELVNGVDSVLEFWLTAGRFTEKLEKQLGEYLGLKYVSLTNSGSSANLLAIAALTSPLLPDNRRLKKGDEVITVAAAFPTTVTPILQVGAIPVFVDIKIPYYNIDSNMLEKAYSEGKTKAVILAHSLGNPFNLKAVKAFCDAHDLWLVEDNCDALGAEYTIDGVTKKTGAWGDIGTSSFYPAHHMTMGEGGAVYTDNPVLNRAIRSFRDWGRDCHCLGGHDNMCGHRYDGNYGQLPHGYDHKYVYSHFGYNLKITDIQAAIGSAQAEKVPQFADLRRQHAAYYFEKLDDLQDRLILPKVEDGALPSWFGFPITVIREEDRDRIVQALEGHHIQTRMLFSGNIIRHPCFDGIRGTDAYRVVGTLEDSDRTLYQTFWIGVYPGMTEEMMDYTVQIIRDTLKN